MICVHIRAAIGIFHKWIPVCFTLHIFHNKSIPPTYGKQFIVIREFWIIFFCQLNNECGLSDHSRFLYPAGSFYSTATENLYWFNHILNKTKTFLSAKKKKKNIEEFFVCWIILRIVITCMNLQHFRYYNKLD